MSGNETLFQRLKRLAPMRESYGALLRLYRLGVIPPNTCASLSGATAHFQMWGKDRLLWESESRSLAGSFAGFAATSTERSPCPPRTQMPPT